MNAAPRAERTSRTAAALAFTLAGCVLLALAGCVPLPEATPAGPTVRLAALAPGDSIAVEEAADGSVILDITSARGIGRAEIERLGPAPASLVLRLRLKGLEEFRLVWGDTEVTAHVGSGSPAVRQELSRPGATPSAAAAEIDSTSPYWLPIRIEAANPTIPLADGFFAVSAPPAFLQAAPARFTVRWIDFYR
jgi:hypothetical protein